MSTPRPVITKRRYTRRHSSRSRLHPFPLIGLWVLPMLSPVLPAAAAPGDSTPPTNPPRRRAGSELRVGDNGRYLVHSSNGKPFFWLGDTAWLLFQIPTREDADLYLKTRARQGFTVIQAALVMGEERVGGTLRPNAYGDLAFKDGDPSKPNVTAGTTPQDPAKYDYWDHADYLIERAKAHKLTLGLLPLFVGSGGDGYKYLTPGDARAYGEFLGRRYGGHSHVFWILGGDNTPDTEAKRAVWDRMARGIAAGTGGATETEEFRRTLMTYHINSENSSSQWFHAASWLDFNMAQVWGHEKGIHPKLAADYALSPVKPTGLGEGSYEDGPQYPTRPIDALKVRRQAYWSYFAGGYHTYGNTNTWNFGSYKPEGTQDWKAALHSPGAASLSVLATFFTSLGWWRFAPDPSVIADGRGEGDTLNAALRTENGDALLAYFSHPSTVTLRMDRLTAAKDARAAWIDPRTGKRSAIGDVPASGIRTFTSPDGWPDALLLVQAKKR